MLKVSENCDIRSGHQRHENFMERCFFCSSSEIWSFFVIPLPVTPSLLSATMNTIRQIRELNKQELEAGISPQASWHADYRDTAYIYIGGLPFDLSEGDIITIFSQYGEPVFINLIRDKETGKSKGFCFLKYEDQRSCDLAVDNMGGTTIMGRVLRVDHTRYKRKDDEPEGDNTLGDAVPVRTAIEDESEEEVEQRPMLKEEKELAELMRDHDDDDPMKAYLIEQKKEEVEEALKQFKKQERKDEAKHERHRHSSRRHRRSRSPSEPRTKHGRVSRRRSESRDRSKDRSRDRSRDRRRSRSREDRKRKRRSRSRSEHREDRRDRERASRR
jgi:RNA-binding motif protein, X-linked 2